MALQKQRSYLLFIIISASITIIFFIFQFWNRPSSISTNPQPFNDRTNTVISNLSMLHRPEYPALVLQGPPKCGTRTFVNTLSKFDNVIQYGPERDFWAGPNKWRCHIRYNKSEWIAFIGHYNAYNRTLHDLVDSILTDPRNAICTVERYKWHWNKIKPRSFIASHWHNKSCQHPNTTNMSNYCYLIEKGPVYARSPWVGMIFVYLMPNVKLLTIVRNPLKQIVSALYAFPDNVDLNGMASMNATYRWLIAQFHDDFVFMNLSRMCSQLNAQWNGLSQTHSAKQRYLKMSGEYRMFLGNYLRNRFVDPMFLREPRTQMFKWSGFLLPSLLSTLLAWEERIGHAFMIKKWNPMGDDDEFNQAKYIQFEWMFANMDSAMQMVRCWMMDKKNGCDDDDGQQIIFGKVEKTNSFRSQETRQENEYYQNEMNKLWNPCNEAMFNIIRRDRPQLLLGGWKEW